MSPVILRTNEIAIVNLKKLIFRKDLALITHLIQDLDPTIVVRSVEGVVLIGLPAIIDRDFSDADPGLPIQANGDVTTPNLCNPDRQTAASRLSELGNHRSWHQIDLHRDFDCEGAGTRSA